MLRVYQVDVFTRQALAGNPAVVVPKGASLSRRAMQSIAREMNVSETAFLMPSRRADLRIRYFTPKCEVSICGHATVASFAVLYDEGIVKDGRLNVETRAGVLPVEIEPHEKGARVWLGLNRPRWEIPQFQALSVSRMLGVPIGWIANSLPLRVAGGELLMVPLAARADLTKVEPIRSRWKKFSNATGVREVCAFRVLNGAGTKWMCRFFAPGCGIWEDPVTGVANGRIAQYLVEEGQLTTGAEARGDQGHEVGRPGVVFVRVEGERRAARVFIGGDSVISMYGVLAA